MATTYFVTENYLKATTGITKTVDIADVNPLIKTASDMWIQAILGTYFYEYLLTKYNAQSLTPNEETLVSKIQPVIAWRTAADAVFFVSRKLKGKGIQRENGENSDSVELNELAFAMKHYNQKAEFYTSRAINYLKTNKSLFPNFTSKLNTDSDIAPNNDPASSYNSDFLII